MTESAGKGVAFSSCSFWLAFHLAKPSRAGNSVHRRAEYPRIVPGWNSRWRRQALNRSVRLVPGAEGDDPSRFHITTKEARVAIDSFIANTPGLEKLKEYLEACARRGWLPLVDGIRQHLGRTGLEDTASTDELMLFSYPNPHVALTSLLENLEKGKYDFGWNDNFGALPVQVILHPAAVQDLLSDIRDPSSSR